MLLNFARSRKPAELAFWSIFSFSSLAIFTLVLRSYHGISSSKVFSHAQEYGSREAVVTYLSRQFDAETNTTDDQDNYFVDARLLAYQLLHAPETKSRRPIPFVVLVTKDVKDSKRERLEEDGAIIVEIPTIDVHVDFGEPNWVDTYTKLFIFNPDYVPYEKVLYVDTDTVFTRPIDSIFDDPGTAPRKSLTDPDLVRNDEGEIPSSYIFAAVGETTDQQHTYPASDPLHEKSYFNSGFFVYSPSHLLLNHYLLILQDPDRFLDKMAPDQDLFNYAHRWKGAMPWSSIDFSWSILWPNEDDLKGGLAALHAKWWKKGEGINRAVHEFCLGKRWEMQGYWTGRSKSGAN
jgi:alpha-N-acetylglucosamine transferase